MEALQRSSIGRPPVHVAVIMDGNGRWAQARGLPRTAGHREGANAVRRAMTCAMSRPSASASSARLRGNAMATPRKRNRIDSTSSAVIVRTVSTVSALLPPS